MNTLKEIQNLLYLLDILNLNLSIQKKEDGSGVLWFPILMNLNFDICTKNIRFKDREDAYTATGVTSFKGYYTCTNYDICQKKNKRNSCKDFAILEKELE